MCDTRPHHRLLHADELGNAPLSLFYFLGEVSIERARADSPALGVVARGIVWSADVNEWLE